VETLTVGDGSVFAGGEFRSMDGLPQSFVAGLSANPVSVSKPPEPLWSSLASRPNPFVTSTTIGFSLPTPALVTLELYDAAGRRVATLLDRERRAAGPQQVVLDARHLASGVYLAHLEADGRVSTQRIVLLHDARSR
jgi:type IX secretion system substrate protein